MAMAQPPPMNVNKNPAKKKGKNCRKTKSTYCILCRKWHFKYESQEHMHSMLHHRELEMVLGKETFHECFVCKFSTRGILKYSQHISTAEHKANLKSMSSKPLSLYETLPRSDISQILNRNSTLAKKKKKLKKKKSKMKQMAHQRPVKTQQQKSSARDNAGTQIQGAHQTEGNYAVVQNKENKMARVQRSFYQMEAPMHYPSGRFPGFSEQHAWRTYHPGFVRGQFPQPPHQMRNYSNFSVRNQFFINRHPSQTRRQYNTQSATAGTPEQMAWHGFNEHGYENRQYSGAVVFKKGQNECAQSAQPGFKALPSSSNPAPENPSTSAAPVKDIDVPSMLKQIRRALGVREPCRAEREARKQSSEAAVRGANCSTTQQTETQREQCSGAGTKSVQSPQVCTPAAHAGVSSSNIASANPNVRQETTQHSEMTSVVDDGLSSNKDRESQGALGGTISRKVRMAHRSGKSQEVRDGLKPTLNKFTLTGAKKKQSWSGVKRKNQNKFFGGPRFGINLAKPSTDQAGTSQPQDADLPLSEGFHWDSIPKSPSDTNLNLVPPAQDTADTDPHRGSQTPSDSQIQEPCTEQQGGSSPIVTACSIKAEPKWEHENQVLRNNCSAKKRQHKDNDDSVDKQPSVQMKRAKSNKDQHQMDQLLAVSLREDELSHSLQDLDKNLVQARKALQAAFAEVQQLLLLRQQYIAEVNCLRTKRIEILQGMQECYSKQPACLMPATPATATLSTVSQPLSPSTGLTVQFDSPCTTSPQVPLNHPVPLFPSNLLPPLLLPPSHVAVPMLPPSVSKSVNTESSARQQEQESREGLKDGVKTGREEQEAVWAVEKDSQEEVQGNQVKERWSAPGKTVPDRGRHTSAAVPVDSDDSGNDDSVKIMESSKVMVIDIDESEDEDLPDLVSDVPLHQECPASVELRSAITQTRQQCEVDRKIPSFKEKETPVETVEDEEPSLGVFPSHTGPVHALQIHEGLLYTCSGDNAARAYSLVTKECKAVFDGHTNKVNCLLVSSLPNMLARLYTGSSDQTIRCYSIKSQKCLEKISLQDRVLCLHIAWNTLYAGLANGSVASYDLKTMKQQDVFECHGPRGVSCLGTAQEGVRRVLLVGSYDGTISVRDAKSGLLLRSLDGHTKTVLCLKVVNDLVFSGSSDTSVHAHNIHTGELVQIYKGHGHAVTSVSILGKVMVTACLDKLVRVYELQSHDRLQVYGGHSDMVMCMSIHKSVIYTGCYDGSIQAVKLNLMKNFRCWWNNCSLIFGMAEHLVQHLVGDHTNQSLQTVKCRWRGCDSFFSTQQSVQQELPDHMQSHVENDSKIQS